MKKLSLIFIFVLLPIAFSHAIPRRMLYEFTTATNCTHCACMDSVVKKVILVNYPQTVVLAYHTDMVVPPPSPYNNFEGRQIVDTLCGWEVDWRAAPLGFADRSFFYPLGYDNAFDSTVYRYANYGEAPVEISILTKSYNASTRTLTVTVQFRAVQNLNGQYRVNFVISENNLISYQAEGECGPTNYNFDHDWVTRSMANGYLGELLINGNWTANQTFTNTYTKILSSDWVPENCDFALFVFKATYDIRHAEVMQAYQHSVTAPIGIQKEDEVVGGYFLWQNYPNPFNPRTNIKFSIPKSGETSLIVYDMLGRESAVLFNGKLESGVYNAEFNTSVFNSGIYYAVLRSGGYSETLKMVCIK